jgi:hypothetical protein
VRRTKSKTWVKLAGEPKGEQITTPEGYTFSLWESPRGTKWLCVKTAGQKQWWARPAEPEDEAQVEVMKRGEQSFAA